MVYAKTFCCFWDTRSGCIAIGYLSGGLSVICCVGSVLRLFQGLPEVLLNDDYQGEFPFNPLFFVFSALYFAFHTITSFSLVPAVKEGQGMFIVPTLVMLFIDFLLDCIAVIVVAMKLGKNNDLETFLITGIVIGSVLAPLLIYSSVIVISHFEEKFQQLDQVPLQKSKTPRRKDETTYASSTDNSETSFGTIV